MDEKEVCKNCQREIPSVNYVMHLAHCLRNTEICGECGEPVLIAQKEEHHRENHQTVKCGLCGQESVPAKLNNHMENSCLEKLVECSICGIEIPFRKLNDHELYCGSRTELCEKCNKYVMIKDLEKHHCAASSPLQENVTIPCEFCEDQIELSELKRHQTTCPQAPNGEDDFEMLDDLRANTPHERPDTIQQDDDNGEETTDGIGEAYNSIYALPCEFCKELCPSDKLHEHQLQCDENPETIDNDDHDNDYDDTRNANALELPCEFCNDLYPLDTLNEHQLQCRKNPETVVVDDDDNDETSSDEPRSFDRWDTFEIVYHPFLFGSVFNSTMTHPHDWLFRANLHDPWGMLNGARR